MGALLQQGEESPFIAVNEQGRSPFVLICEHASNTLPKALGIPPVVYWATGSMRHSSHSNGGNSNQHRIIGRLMARQGITRYHRASSG